MGRHRSPVDRVSVAAVTAVPIAACALVSTFGISVASGLSD
jgi:hypothetical protein